MISALRAVGVVCVIVTSFCKVSAVCVVTVVCVVVVVCLFLKFR